MRVREALDKGQTLENDGVYPKALEIYETGLKETPDSYPLLMGAGRMALKLENDADGLTYFEKARDARRDRHEPVVNIANIQSKNDPAKAAQTLAEGLSDFPDSYALLMGAGRLAEKQGDIAAALSHFERAGTVSPERPEPIVNIGRLQAETDLVAAAKTLADGVAKFPDNRTLRDLLAEAQIQLNSEGSQEDGFDFAAELEKGTQGEKVFLAVLHSERGERSEEEVSQCYGLLADKFQRDSSLVRYAQSLIGLRKYQEALDAYDRVKNPQSDNVLMGKAICCGAMGDFETSKAHLERYLDGDESEHNVLRACTTFLSESSDLRSAAAIIAKLNKTYNDTALDHIIAFSEEILPPKRALLAGGIRDNSFRLSDAGDARAVMLAFSGFALQTGAIPFSLLDRFFAGHGIAAGSLVDASGCLYWNGVPSLGDGFDATISELKSLLNAINADKIYTLGTSGGGAAAMVYGCELGAQRAISFAGPSDLRRSFLDLKGDRRGQAVIHALGKRLSEEQLNVKGWLEAAENRCAIHAYYCEKEPLDVAQAENIADLPEVSLHPVGRYAEHECIASALGTGDLLVELKSVVENVHHG